MKTRYLLIAMLAFAILGCKHAHDHDDDHDEHDHAFLYYTAYTDEYEVYAETEGLLVGETVSIFTHFTNLNNFKAMDSAQVTAVLEVSGSKVSQTLEQALKKGVYNFEILAEKTGTGTLTYIIENSRGTSEVVIPNVKVYNSYDEAEEEAEELAAQHDPNAVAFGKEQSWKVDFATAMPEYKQFGQVIKTTAQVQSAQGNEQVIFAQTGGKAQFSSNSILEGNDVKAGQALISISGGTVDNNTSVKFAEAKSNYEKAVADYERAQELAADRIVSEKDLQAAKNQYDNAKAVYDNLRGSVSVSGQRLSSPMNGFIKQILVQNGAFVEAGEPLMVISQTRQLQLTAEVQQRYAAALPFITSANIRTIHDNQSYTFEQLNGKILSYGKSVNNDNFLIPVNLQINNNGSFINGSFVEVYLISSTGSQSIVVSNSALLEEQGLFFVWVQLTPELFEKREVKTGATDGVSTQITDGITQNERIVSRGAMMIKLAQATGALDPHAGHFH